MRNRDRADLNRERSDQAIGVDEGDEEEDRSRDAAIGTRAHRTRPRLRPYTLPRRGWSKSGSVTPQGAMRFRIFARKSGKTRISSSGVLPPRPASHEMRSASISAGVASPPSRASQRLR